MRDLIMRSGSDGGVPPGAYQGVFVGVEDTPPNEERGYPAGLRWSFKISAGEHSGRTTSRITGSDPKPKNACGKFVTSMNGKPLGDGERAPLESWVGKPFTVVVMQAENGGTRVETVMPIPG